MMQPIALRANLSCEAVVLVPNAIVTGFGDYSLTVNALHWDGDHENRVSLHTESLMLSHSKLNELTSAIEARLQTAQIGVQAFCGTCDLTSDFNITLRFIFADQGDIITPEDKPVLTVENSLSRVTVHFRMVTDQSRFALFAKDMRSHLVQVAYQH